MDNFGLVLDVQYYFCICCHFDYLSQMDLAFKMEENYSQSENIE